MTNPCFGAPRRPRTAATTLVVALIAGLLALVAPAALAGAAPVVQTAGPQGGCPPNSFHSGQAIAYCFDTELTYEITVGGVPVTPATHVVPGDVITVAASAAEGQDTPDVIYAGTGDAIRNNDPDLFAELRIGLPAATGTLLSEPTAIRMARDDTLGRGANSNGSCALQAGEGPNLSDPVTYVDPSDPPLGLSQMLAYDLDGQLRARWDRLGYDRCSSALSLNGISTGFSVVFEQRVLRRASTDETLTWLFDGLTISRDDEAQSRTWGTEVPVGLQIDRGTAPPTPGNTPTAVAGNGQATVTWRAPNGDGGAPITAWEVVPYVGGTAQATRVIRSSDPTAVVTGLTNGTTYTFRVRGRTALGVSNLGPASNAVTPVAPSTVPVAPELGAAPVIGNGRAFVRWLTPHDGGSPLTGYRVTPYIGGVPQTPRTFSASATAQNVTQLANGSAYTFTVAAANSNGYGAESAHTPEVTPLGWPTEVRDLRAVNEVGGKVKLLFTPPESDGGRPVTRYEVRPLRDGIAEPVQTFTDLDSPPVVTGLQLGATYRFEMVAVNEIGTGSQGPFSNEVVPLAQAGAPTITATTAGDRTIDVTWTAPSSNGGTPITRYEAAVVAGSAFATSTSVGGSARTARITGLTNGVTYRVVVLAETSYGFGQVASSSPITPRGVPHAPFGSADAFTRRQFVDLAGRAPTSAELSSWRTSLGNGSRTAPALIESLRTAPHWDGTLGPIVRLYRAVYLRDPELAGLQYWEAQVRSGRRSLNQVANFMATNQEFRNLYGTLSTSAFVTKVYELVLDRAPSSADLSYWSGQIQRGQPRGRIVLLFSTSNEYKVKTAHRVAVIEMRYGMLDAVPTRAQMDAALAALASGQTYQDLVAAILASPEYAATLS